MNGNGNLSKMKTWHKCLLSSLGALMPLIMSLYFAEFDVFMQKFSLALFVGYAIKVIILIILGGLIGYFYRSETSGMKLFQLGIAAPTIILGFINGQTLGQSDKKEGSTADASFISLHIPESFLSHKSFIDLQDPVINFQDVQIQQYTFPEESVKQELFRGFTGTKITRNWFLIYESYTDVQEAKVMTANLNNQFPEPGVHLYQSLQNPEKFDVVVGAHLEYKEGLKLQKEYSNQMNKNLILWEYNPVTLK